MHSSTLPSLRSSFSATWARLSIAVIASRSVRQVSVVVEQRLAPGFDGFDMRLLAHLLHRQLPHLCKSRVEQLRAAVAAEHGDRFGEVVERFPLHPDQPVKAPRQIEAFGDVVEQIGDAALEVRRGHDLDGAAVGQEPGVGFRLDRAIGLVQLGLPGAEVRLLRQLAGGAQPVEHARIIRIGVEEGLVEAPQPPVGFVVEGEPPLGVEHGNAGGELVERAAVRFRHPRQRRVQPGHFAGVDGDAAAAPVKLERMHVKGLALAADHDRQPGGIGDVVVERPAQFAALVGLQQFELAGDRIGRALGLGGPGIGRIGVAQLALGALGPDRPGRGGGKIAQQFGFFLQRLEAQIRFGEFPAQSAEFANPDNGLPADGAAHRLDGAAGRGGEVEQKSLARFAQAIDRVIHLQRRFRRQPGSKGKDALRRIRAETSSAMSPLIRGRSSPAAQEISTCGSANSSARSRSAWACKAAISTRSRNSFRTARSRVRIKRIAATTEKPSSASAVVRTANSW